MLIEIRQVQQEYQRLSKQGIPHTYSRKREIAILQCDSCNTTFERRVRNIDPRRLTADHLHVCGNCNQKRYAQSRGAESRRFWNTTVDLDRDIDSI
jgi:hypothetical protein